MTKVGIPCIPTFRWIWNCCGTFNIVEKVTQLGRGSLDKIVETPDYTENYKSSNGEYRKYNPLKSLSVRGIVGQLLATLHYLKSYNFTHGNPSIESLAFSRAATSFTYDDTLIVSPFTMFMIPSGLSSISIKEDPKNVVRIYHPGNNENISYTGNFASITSSVFLNVNYSYGSCDPRNKNVVPCLPSYEKDVTIGYKIGKEYDYVSQYIQKLGVPLFYKSYDLYAFLISLMINPAFRDGIILDQPLYDLWKTMWDPKEYTILMSDIDEYNLKGKTTFTSKEILVFLSNYTLRCDAIDHMWEGYKIIQPSSKSNQIQDIRMSIPSPNKYDISVSRF